MASRDVEDSHGRTARSRYPASPQPAAGRDWRYGGEATLNSLPYRRPGDLIQGPDENVSSHGRSRASRTNSGASAPIVKTMPLLPRTSTAETYRRGRFPVTTYDYDDGLYAEEGLLPTGWRSSPARDRSPTSPRRSRRHIHESRKSSTSSRRRSETESEAESVTSVSTDEKRRQRRQEKARAHRPLEERRSSAAEKKPKKRRRKIREIVYVEEDDESIEPMPRRSRGDQSRSPRRNRSRLSRSVSERHHSRRRSYSPVRRSSVHPPIPRESEKTYKIVSKPRDSPKKVVYGVPSTSDESGYVPPRALRRHRSGIAYVESRPVRRSNTVSGASHATSHSTVSSSRRSSSFLGHVMAEEAHFRASDKSSKLVKCVACMDDFRPMNVVTLECNHHMCNSCLKQVFKLSASGPQSMPPRCCTSDFIPLEHVERLLPASFKERWNRKFAEYSIRNRIYCPSRRCGEWIKPADIYRRGGRQCGKCSNCKTEVCFSCKGRWHSSRKCPDDEDTTRFLERAKKAGWQRCYKCSLVVDLDEGNNHMSCRCGAQSCIICGVKWKNCQCPWFGHETSAAQAPGGMVAQLDRLDLKVNSRSRPRVDYEPPPPRSRSGEYDDRLARRFRGHRDDERRLSAYEDSNLYDRASRDIINHGLSTAHFMNDDYGRETDGVLVSAPHMPVPPAPTPPTAFERPTPADYMSGVNRARGLPHDMSGHRLAERFSEHRTGPGGARAGMIGGRAGPPLAPMTAPLMGPPPPLPPMGPPPPLTAPMASGHSPLVAMRRRYNFEDDVYDDDPRAMRRPSERAGHEWTGHGHAREATSHALRSRQPRPAEPKSSTLAGLTGPGRGMNRVDEWRNHVQPGAPEGTFARV
ncbi:putative E3 ubiquitin-protein ligase ARI3 [Colletotrichum spinosum]|uniref:RBR-type E3 ubiquitin transferase n=1 Tax=Colletotrichum spinosum TaxID=1347390 RepID=A0A4R8Q1F5_9PEZI|nr:putative E3 ubiquitin-protein ligase ARI3 [Colletotrichum spinosum]